MEKRKYSAPQVLMHNDIAFETAISGAPSGHWEYVWTGTFWKLVWVND